MNKKIAKEKLEAIYNRPGVTGRDAAKELGMSRKDFDTKFKEYNIELTKRGEHTRNHFEDSFRTREVEAELAETKAELNRLKKLLSQIPIPLDTN